MGLIIFDCFWPSFLLSSSSGAGWLENRYEIVQTEFSSSVYWTVPEEEDNGDDADVVGLVVDVLLLLLLRKSSSIALACSRSFRALSKRSSWSLLLLLLLDLALDNATGLGNGICVFVRFGCC